MTKPSQTPNQNFPDNVLYQADNLDILRGMNSETVDLIATDPPFNTRQVRSGAAGAYPDKWKWGSPDRSPNEVDPKWLEQIKETNPPLAQVIQTAGSCHSQDMAAFICFLGIRLIEMHRVLKPTGSLYIHCDQNANSYIRLALDAIFSATNLRNEIAWRRYGSHNDAKNYGRVYDTILYYTKRGKATWNGIWQDLNQGYVQKTYRHHDQRGRYRTAPLHTGGLSGRGYRYEFRGYNREWRYPGQRMQQLEAEDRIRQGRDGQGIPERKVYLHENKGKPISNFWDDVPALTGQNEERTGAPDQKPLALYERMILASSNQGDLVLDPFAGSGTTLIAAQKNGRRWVGIDRRADTRLHLLTRLKRIQPQAKHEFHFRTTAPTRSLSATEIMD